MTRAAAFLNATGGAIGTLSTVAIAPLAGSNGVADLRRELDYAAASGTAVSLVNGTEPFTPDVVGAILGGGLAAARRARAGTVRARRGALE